MPYNTVPYAHRRNLIIAVGASIGLHILVFSLLPFSEDTRRTDTPPTEETTTVSLNPQAISAFRARTAPEPVEDTAETLASQFITTQPVEEQRAPHTHTKRPQRAGMRPPEPPPPRQQLDASSIIASGLALAASGLLGAESDALNEDVASLNSLSSSPVYASYLAAWTRKVERVGRLNYPDREMDGHREQSLLMDVILNADGQVQDTEILRSSGNRLLDQAAISIIRIAAPFPPFPPEMAKKHPRLSVTRRWRFADQGLGIRP